MKSRCKELEVINSNISEAINSICTASTKQPPRITDLKSIEPGKGIVSSQEDKNENMCDNEICELCPVCQGQAYGKTVQCGSCWEWYHYYCLKINDSAIETLGNDDFVCRLCTEDLLYSAEDNDLYKNTDKHSLQCNKPDITCVTPGNIKNTISELIEISPNTNLKSVVSPNTNPKSVVKIDMEKLSVSNNITDNSGSQADNTFQADSTDNSCKSRPKRLTKPIKLKRRM